MSRHSANQYPASMTAIPGIDFEHMIQTYFLLIMILGKTPPFIDPNAKINKLVFQYKQHDGEYGPRYNTDDLVAYANVGPRDIKILVNIKEEIEVKSPQFNDVIKNAYLDINGDFFNQENDIVLLATRSIDAKKSSLIRIANIAKNTHSYKEAFLLGNRDSTEESALKTIKEALKKNKIDATDDDVYILLRNFDILSMDIRQTIDKKGYPGILSLIYSIIRDNCRDGIDPHSMWILLKDIITNSDNISNIIDINEPPLQLLEICDKFLTNSAVLKQKQLAIEPTNLATILLGGIDSSKKGDLELFDELDQEIG